MNVRVAENDSQIFLEGTPGTRLIQAPDEVLDIIGSCFEHNTRSVMLYAENLTEQFFDLSSGEAGEILQKFRNYHIRVAVVLPKDESRLTGKFREMAAEENKADYIRFFEDRDSAEAWLIGK